MSTREVGRCQKCNTPVVQQTVCNADGIAWGPMICEKCEKQRSEEQTRIAPGERSV